MRTTIAFALSSATLAALIVATGTGEASAVTMAWSPVGNPGNAADPATGFGAVGYSYKIGTYDVTNSQYVEFLNAKDPTGANTLGLYSASYPPLGGGIKFTSGAVTGSKYSIASGAGNHPVGFINWYDAARFANWLNNGQGNSDTETGAYTLLGGTPTPSNASSVIRNVGATVFLPSESEWYKAAYYSPGNSSYFQYPTSSNTVPVASVPTGVANHANFSSDTWELTDVGAYTGTSSPYGAFDMAGNVRQWNEPVIGMLGQRAARGGDVIHGSDAFLSSSRSFVFPGDDTGFFIGFRVASVPEPSSLVLLGVGAIGLAAKGWRRRNRQMA